MTAGKGSKQRPQQVPDEQVSDSWKTIFRPLCTDCGKRQAPGQIHTCTTIEPTSIGSSLIEDQKNED